MHWLTKGALSAALAWASLSLPALADGNIADGQAKSSSCAACHGATGKASNALYPNLAGQNEAYLALALHGYKNGGRTGGQAGVMQAFTAGLSDQDISDLSAFYASQKP
ncbi:c-type cytochrome [Rouxiella badensis]|uniref:Cytochrome C554 n=1 Tax=Rouxiella badensis TaxID=1646377 RepID=A0A1X0WAN6_9GAMM|nr:cytochrome c [Rouxiella badensis]ORJ23840.1 cytochrome C554 [Rouxiella badensis]QOI57697.1 cytochrome c [Rouxiella badensis subsp. acadiensis]WAT06768.1 cytochrome c [Rouxiella badensis]